MLVFTNIIPVLAFSTSDNYFSDSNNVNFVQTATTTTTTTTKPNYTYTTTPNYYYPV
jgi:hypothetical protein